MWFGPALDGVVGVVNHLEVTPPPHSSRQGRTEPSGPSASAVGSLRPSSHDGLGQLVAMESIWAASQVTLPLTPELDCPLASFVSPGATSSTMRAAEAPTFLSSP